MKKILVPTDFSQQAEYALNTAAQIAKKTNSEIFLLHIVELPHNETADAINHGSAPPEILFFLKKIHEKFNTIKNQKNLKGITINETVQFKGAFESIIEFSKKQGVDLIIMGSKGSNGFEEIFIGSNTEKVIRTSDIPVLVIKKDYDISATKNFVFASDFSDQTKNAFKKAVDFATFLDAHINLLLINTPNDFRSTNEAEQLMQHFVRNTNLSADTYSLHFYNDINIEKGILNFSNKINADLIGICTHGRKGLNHFFNGSISEDLANHTFKPVITFKM